MVSRLKKSGGLNNPTCNPASQPQAAFCRSIRI